MLVLPNPLDHTENTIGAVLKANPLWLEAYDQFFAHEEPGQREYAMDWDMTSECGKSVIMSMVIAESMFALGFETREAQMIRELVVANAVVWIFG